MLNFNFAGAPEEYEIFEKFLYTFISTVTRQIFTTIAFENKIKKIFWFFSLHPSADVPVAVEFIKQAAKYHDDEYAYVIIDLENKLDAIPWKILIDAIRSVEMKVKPYSVINRSNLDNERL